ncbi:MAG: cation transporter [Clostridia bacterium]|nr:cation transporter [Clostridia bacterium]
MEELDIQNKDVSLTDYSKAREKGIVATSFVGIGGNVLLVAIKAVVGFLAGSISLIMDALNNLTDALSSIITIIGTKLSNKKPDRKHPYGHGRIEYLTATIIGAIILFAGGMAIYESIVSIVDYFSTKIMPNYTVVALILIGVGIIIKLGIGLFYRIQAKKLNSDTLKASATDALFDVALSLGTLVSAIVALYGHFYIEGYVGIVIGLFILKSGFGIIRESLSLIIGIRIDDETTTKIKVDIASIDGVYGVYDLILNNYGTNKYIGSVHIAVKEDLNAQDIMTLEKKISGMMYLKYNMIMTVGVYAENISSPVAKEIKSYLDELTSENENILSTHGFYINEEEKFVFYDIVISFDDKTPQDTCDGIKEKLKEKFPEYKYICNIDYDY